MLLLHGRSLIIVDELLLYQMRAQYTFENAARFLEQHPDTRERFNRVAELVEGFESPFGLELLSTVHWVMAQDNILKQEDVIDSVYKWNDRKQQFTPRQIGLSIEILSKKGWVKA